MLVYHVHNAHTTVFVYNAWIKALSLRTIEPERERKQYSASDHTIGKRQLRTDRIRQ